MRRAIVSALFAGIALALDMPASAHDFERTQVVITFARDGSFGVDVTNDTPWLQHRLIPFGGNFIDRVVLFVDGHEIRPTSVEFIRGDLVSTYRLRGRMPRGKSDARALRWYYGLVIDPYPLTIRRADGRVRIEEVAGDAWSRTIDISGQFQQARAPEGLGVALVIGLLLAPALRFALMRNGVDGGNGNGVDGGNGITTEKRINGERTENTK